MATPAVPQGGREKPDSAERTMKLWIGLAGVFVVLFSGAILWVATQDSGAQTSLIPAGLKEQTAFPPLDQPQPKVQVVGEESFDFGQVEPHSKGKHIFQIKNVGEGPLVIKPGQTTCKCTFLGLDVTTIAPGETGDIPVEWTPEAENPKFAQSAQVFTNDRNHPQINFVVHGQVVKLVALSPASLYLPAIPSATEVAGDLTVFSPTAEEFKITKWSFADENTARFFEVRIEGADAGKLAELQAKSGYRIQVLVKPGLPLGRFQQTIRLESSIPNAAEVTAPVYGTISGHLSLYGDSSSWNEEAGILTLGTVNPAVGAHFDMLLRVRGPHQDIQVESVKVMPSKEVLTLKVLGEAEKARNGKSISIPLRIEVPKGAPAINCLGSGTGSIGQILIKTNHPETPELRLMVSFAVRGE